jgi:hypothetical protein
VDASQAWQVPRCKAVLGKVALVESSQAETMPGSAELANPLLRLFAQISGCFVVIDHGPAKALASGATVGGGAGSPKDLPDWGSVDFVLTARTIYQDVRVNDLSASSLVSQLFPTRSTAYSTSGGLATTETEVGVVLLLADARTGRQVAAEFGLATKSDVTLTAFNSGAFAAFNPSGKTTSAALFHAFGRLVGSLNAL